MADEVSGAPDRRSPHASAIEEMAQGRSVGRGRMVGDECRHAAGGGDITAICERVSALRAGPMDRGLAQETSEGTIS